MESFHIHSVKNLSDDHIQFRQSRNVVSSFYSYYFCHSGQCQGFVAVVIFQFCCQVMWRTNSMVHGERRLSALVQVNGSEDTS